MTDWEKLERDRAYAAMQMQADVLRAKLSAEQAQMQALEQYQAFEQAAEQECRQLFMRLGVKTCDSRA